MRFDSMIAKTWGSEPEMLMDTAIEKMLYSEGDVWLPICPIEIESWIEPFEVYATSIDLWDWSLLKSSIKHEPYQARFIWHLLDRDELKNISQDDIPVSSDEDEHTVVGNTFVSSSVTEAILSYALHFFYIRDLDQYGVIETAFH